MYQSMSAGVLAVCLLASCQLGTETRPSILPLRTLRLYETGVGYFERSGAITDGTTALPVPAGHLDDALKTLVVLGPGGKGVVEGLAFGSSMSKGMARALTGLPTAADAPINYRDLLFSLKGAPVELRTAKARFHGRIIDVVEAPQGAAASHGEDKAGAAAAPELTVLLLTDNTEIVRLPAQSVQSVRPTDAGSSARLGAALDALSTRVAQTQRLLQLLQRNGGPATIGYVTETPIWRTTYRLVFADGPGDKDKGAVLQGWALLHNDSDEDWSGVRVHLVNGRPDSFLYPLAAPRYERRELVAPDTQLSTVPQLLDTTVDAIWGDNSGEVGLGGIGYGSGSGSSAGHISLGGIGTVGHGAGAAGPEAPRESDQLTVGNLAAIAAADGIEAGALFTYTLATPLTLRGHSSVLVPFLQQPVAAERMTRFNGPGEAGRVTVLVSNRSQKTLPEGPIACFSDGGFAGEAVLPRLKPGERRFLGYGTDLDVELRQPDVTQTHRQRRHVFYKDVLTEHFLQHGEASYLIENRGGQPRQVALRLALGSNAQVQGADRVDFDGEDKKPLALFQVPAKTRVERHLITVEGLSQRHALSDLSPEFLSELAGDADLPPAERAILGQALPGARDIGVIVAQMTKLKDENQKAEQELKRWREDLHALAGDKGAGAAPQNPIVGRILGTEDRLSAQKRRLAALEEELGKRRKALETVLGALRPGG